MFKILILAALLAISHSAPASLESQEDNNVNIAGEATTTTITTTPFPTYPNGTRIEKVKIYTLESTLIMVKPEGVQRGLVGEIIKRFELRGFQLSALKFLHPDEKLIREHYHNSVNRTIFPGLLSHMTSGPVVPMVWTGFNAIKLGRDMIGAEHQQDSAPGSIRGDFAIRTDRNVIHGSDTPESAQREIALWFKPEEIVKTPIADHSCF